MQIKMKPLCKLLCAALILSPALANADINTANVTQTTAQANNAMIAAQPVIAKPSLYTGNKNKTDNTSQSKDILITTPKNVIGGSGRQDSDISRYLGINY